MLLKRPRGLRGMQQQAFRVSAALQAQGVDVRVVGHTRRLQPAPGHWDPSIPVDCLRARNRWGFCVAQYRHLLSHRDRYDLVHLHGVGLELLPALAARRVTRKPLLVKPGTAGPGTFLHRCARARYAPPAASRAIWSQVDGWICISEQTLSDVLGLGVDRSVAHLIPNGVDTRVWRPLDPSARAAARTGFGATDSELVVCTSAKLVPRKKVDLLVRAFCSTAGTHRGRLWIMGEGPQSGELQRLASSLPGGDRVELLGVIPPEQVRARLQAADLFALLSEWEGLSNALLEAMACGLPAVVTRVSGMVDVVEDGRSGILVPLNIQAPVEDALTALTDAPVRRRLAAGAIERVAGSYSLQTTAAKLATLYRELLDAPRPAEECRTVRQTRLGSDAL
jgi:glycosyltransferase involved in cell wall biosynthesis